MPRFLLSPRWALSHLVVAALVITMIWAGLWQVRRHVDRQDIEAELAARTEAAPVGVAELLDTTPPDERRFRRVTLDGTWDAEGQILVRPRSLDGRPGAWIVTPLVFDDGTGIAVVRGWVRAGVDPDEPEVAPPAGLVRTTGVVQASQERGWIGPTDAAEGQLDRLHRLDVGRLDQQVEADLGPVFAQLIVDPGEIAPQAAPNVAGEEAPVRSALEPVPAIEDDPPPHLSYAAQWFIFTIIALVGYPLILRRSIRQHELDSFDDLDDLDDPPGSGDAHTPDPPPIPDQALTGSSRPRVSN